VCVYVCVCVCVWVCVCVVCVCGYVCVCVVCVCLCLCLCVYILFYVQPEEGFWESKHIAVFSQNKINKVILDFILLPYLSIGSEHNGDALPKSYKIIP